jgi:hypothetical protein
MMTLALRRMTGRAWLVVALVAGLGLPSLALPVHAEPTPSAQTTPPAPAASASASASASAPVPILAPAPAMPPTAAPEAGPPPSSPAPAPSACAPPTPPQPTRRFHWVAGLAPGSCVRDDDNVGGTGFCGEVFGGLAFQMGRWDHPPERWRLGLELGVGYMHPSSAGYADLGLTQASGGGYAVVRGMIGYDWTSLFYGQIGAQMRVTYFTDGLDWVTPGVQAVGELGTRFFVPDTRFFDAGVEVGVRELVGCDGIASAGLGEGNKWTCTFADGTTLFGRLLFP